MTDKTVTRERLSDRVDRMADEFFIENSTENDALHAAAADIRALEKSHADLVAALAYIVDEESGWRFRVDPLEHARSVIEEMRMRAAAALSKANPTTERAGIAESNLADMRSIAGAEAKNWRARSADVVNDAEKALNQLLDLPETESSLVRALKAERDELRKALEAVRSLAKHAGLASHRVAARNLQEVPGDEPD